MSTVIFDFDSTLVRCESLEEILSPAFAGDAELEKRVRQITDLGMEGRIDFRESLNRRLSLVAPTRSDVVAFGENGASWLTPGVPDLITWLLERGTDVKIVSGGLREAILPLGAQLGIGSENVHAVRLDWFPDGRFRGIDPKDGFSISKLEGVKPLIGDWSSPRIVVGDGMTDYHIARDGLAEHFVAFTENVRRQAVAALNGTEANDVAELKGILEELL